MQKRAVVVYQGGIANVFEVECFNMSTFGRDARRLLQATFNDCEMFARGLVEAGWHVASAYCNQAGDITDAKWNDDLSEAPFNEQFSLVRNKVSA